MARRENERSVLIAAVGLAVVLCLTEANLAPGQASKTRRSQRVRMEQVQVLSPDGKVALTILPNAERLTFTVTLGDTPVV
ncbi:MAG TPA: hypothetical protein VMW24_16865, partial [Sedimentisphaerales bacterium]|nr:hypothetical protein [Sedimentisphaerales bacterium]